MRNNKGNTMKNAYIFAGVNGAGKTTLYYNALEQNNDFGRRINIDEIVSAFGDWKNQKDQIRASKIAIKLRNSYIKNSYDFNLETTLCGSSILSLFEKLKENDYTIHLYYVKVDSVDIAKDRVAQRVKKGGHNIDEKMIERRFKESLENLEKVIPLCDKVFEFDNSKNEMELKKITNAQISNPNKQANTQSFNPSDSIEDRVAILESNQQSIQQMRSAKDLMQESKKDSIQDSNIESKKEKLKIRKYK